MPEPVVMLRSDCMCKPADRKWEAGFRFHINHTRGLSFIVCGVWVGEILVKFVYSPIIHTRLWFYRQILAGGIYGDFSSECFRSTSQMPPFVLLFWIIVEVTHAKLWAVDFYMNRRRTITDFISTNTNLQGKKTGSFRLPKLQFVIFPPSSKFFYPAVLCQPWQVLESMRPIREMCEAGCPIVQAYANMFNHIRQWNSSVHLVSKHS